MVVGDALVGIDGVILLGSPGDQICRRIHTVEDTLSIKVALHAKVLQVLQGCTPPSAGQKRAAANKKKKSKKNANEGQKSTAGKSDSAIKEGLWH